MKWIKQLPAFDLPALCLISITCIITGTMAFLKIEALHSWLYMSDIFTFDQAVGETLVGNIGTEFTYGNILAEHGYLYLLLLTPIKLILGKLHLYFLLVLPPIAHAATIMLLYHIYRSTQMPRWVILTALTIYLLPYGLTEGLFERVYGFHPDNLAGPCAVLLTACLTQKEQMFETKPIKTHCSWFFIIPLAALLFLKEEMALVGMVYFITALIIGRKKRDFTLLAACVAFFTMEVILMLAFKNPFLGQQNSHYVYNILSVLNTIQEKGKDFFLPAGTMAAFWTPIAIYLTVFIILVSSTKGTSRYIAALLFAGLTKLTFAVGVGDFRLPWWHCFSGILMIAGAISLHLINGYKKHPRIQKYMAPILAITALLWFSLREMPRISAIHKDTLAAAGRLIDLDVRSALLEMKSKVNPRTVTAIPQYTAIEWIDGYRFSFFPKGALSQPVGIAEYAITEMSNPTHRNTSSYKPPQSTSPEDHKEIPGYSQIAANQHFILFKRNEQPFPKDQRALFIKHFGKRPLGLE